MIGRLKNKNFVKNIDIITFTNVFVHIENLKNLIKNLKIISKNTLVVIENHYLGSVLEKINLIHFIMSIQEHIV